MVRKVGGFTFQELNLTIDDIREHRRGRRGPVLRLRQPARLPARAGHRRHRVPAADAAHVARARRRPGLAGARAAEPRRADLRARALVDRATATTSSPTSGERDHRRASSARPCAATCRPRSPATSAPYNLVFTTNGIACTTATVIAATLGITDLDDHRRRRHRGIRRAHLLLAMFNALQPGVFALSGWDLCGMLTLPPDEVAELLASGDTRWIHRAAHDLMGVDPAATQSDGGHAARPQPLRLAARAARRRDQLPAPAPGDPRRAHALRHRDEPPGRHPRRLAPRHAGAGPPARRPGEQLAG